MNASVRLSCRGLSSPRHTCDNADPDTPQNPSRVTDPPNQLTRSMLLTRHGPPCRQTKTGESQRSPDLKGKKTFRSSNGCTSVLRRMCQKNSCVSWEIRLNALPHRIIESGPGQDPIPNIPGSPDMLSRPKTRSRRRTLQPLFPRR
jgi:hypothetical protein